jgi:hypothetical protein
MLYSSVLNSNSEYPCLVIVSGRETVGMVHTLYPMFNHSLSCLTIVISYPRLYRRTSFIPCYLVININHVHNHNHAKCVNPFVVLDVILL